MNTNETDIKINPKARGKSGTLITSGVYSADHLSTLHGVNGIAVMNKMRRSEPQVQKVIRAVFGPIKSASWSIESASEETKDLDIARVCEQVLINDQPYGWQSKLHEILLAILFGHSVFELIHSNRETKSIGSYTGVYLAFRNQETLTEWKHDPTTGELLSIVQNQGGDIEAQDLVMDAKSLLIFYNEKEGDDNGFGILRPLYGPYKRKLLNKQIQAIGNERGAISTPIATCPDTTKPDSKEYLAAVEALEKFTNAESSYIIVPAGWELNFDNSNTFDPSKIQVSIKAENEEMVGAILAAFLEQGQGGNSAGLASVSGLEKFFSSTLSNWGKLICDTINNKLIPHIVDLNFPDRPEVMPKLTFNRLAESAGKDLMEVVTGFISSNVLTVDEKLEDFIRKIYSLPKKAEGELMDNGESQDDVEDPQEPEPTDEEPKEDPVELSLSEGETINLSEAKTPRGLIIQQKEEIENVIKENLEASSKKLVNDIIRRYEQLPKNRKQLATKDVVVSKKAQLKRQLKGVLGVTGRKALEQVKLEVPSKKDVTLKTEDIGEAIKLLERHELDIPDNIKLLDNSKLPSVLKILFQIQAESIGNKVTNDLRDAVFFKFSSSEKGTADVNIIRQDLENASSDYINGAGVKRTASNVSAIAVNETRNEFLFNEEVLQEVESFTFINANPKSDVCKELAGLTFATNDAESLRYSPPLHHNCKSYLRANLVGLRGSPEISSLSPSDTAKQSITLGEK